MPKISEVFGDKYLNAEHVSPTGDLYTVNTVLESKVGTDDKLVAVLNSQNGDEALLPLNKTNALAMGEHLGDNTDLWAGKPVVLFRSSVMFNGKRTPCIRTRAPASTGGGSGSGSSSAAPVEGSK